MVDTDVPKGSLDLAVLLQFIKEGEGGKGDRELNLPFSPRTLYAFSKLGNTYLAAETSRRWAASHGIHGVAVNPGNCETGMFDVVKKGGGWAQRLGMWVLKGMLAKPEMGALSMGFAGLSEGVCKGDGGKVEYVWPFGRKAWFIREDILSAIERGDAKAFWEWCEGVWEADI